MSPALPLAVVFTLGLFSAALRAETVETDLLIVGGNESAVAAAVQAARLGVKRITLVNDTEWLGGQFSAEGVGAPDEWTFYRGEKVNFPRSGLFAEIIGHVRDYNQKTYGLPSPGNGFCSTETIEPAAAARLFEQFVAPVQDRVKILRRWEVAGVELEGNRVAGVNFQRPEAGAEKLTVKARLTIDSSDWGDVIRLSGAKYAAGPDLKSRFNEPSAPVGPLEAERNEMNPITYCLVVRETEKESIIPEPEGYKAGTFSPMDKVRHWVESPIPSPIYQHSNWSVYTHRRLVDRRHNQLKPGTEKVLLNWPTQDYPLYDFPKRVVDELEATEPGASRKNIVDMTPSQRRIVFADAKRHALGMFHYLQVTSKAAPDQPSFARMELTDEFGTPDRLPPKPYVREGLRLEALAMLTEQDIRTPKEDPRWAKTMVPDGVFGFQFNIDFHPTRRKFLTNDLAGSWHNVHTANRNWSTHTDRAMFPLRGLVPVERDGLLGSSKNIGYSSIVSSALRLHGQMMLCGQASGTVAWAALQAGVEPRAVAADPQKVLEVQRAMLRSGVLLWPFQDLDAGASYFEAANLLAIRGLYLPEADSVDFGPGKTATPEEVRGLLERAGLKSVPGVDPAQPITRGALAEAVWKKLAPAQDATN